MENNIKIGRYRHYKGNEYEVVDCVTHSETMERLVLYRPMYGEGKLWVRPMEMFFERILVEEVEVDRFAFIGKLSE